MNILALALKAMQYKQEIEQTVAVAEDIAKGHVGTTPEITQVKYKEAGDTYAVTIIAQKIFDASDPAIANQAAAVDVGAAIDAFNATQ